MIKCDSCGVSVYPGVLFCKECGTSLFDEQAIAGGDVIQAGGKLHYMLPQNGRRGALDLSDPVWIGRSDPEQGFWPGLDLTEDDGLELGVSRRHALIEDSGSGLVIIDQNSANGTWLDQEQLLPNQPYVMPDPAIMRFGRLIVHFYLG